MDHKTLKALRGSIKKWEGVRDGKVMERGPLNCPLCELFFDRKKCYGCPVRIKTGRPACHSTPYDTWARNRGAGKTATTKRMKAVAQSEINFLKKLLP